MLTICSHQMAAKLTKNLGPPSSTLHVANLPEDLTHVEVKVSLYGLKNVQTLMEHLKNLIEYLEVLASLQKCNGTLAGYVY